VLRSLDRWRRPHHDDVDVQPDELSREGGEAMRLAPRPSLLDGDVLSLCVTQVAQALPECLGQVRDNGG
jgi:hypothetical protein